MRIVFVAKFDDLSCKTFRAFSAVCESSAFNRADAVLPAREFYRLHFFVGVAFKTIDCNDARKFVYVHYIVHVSEQIRHTFFQCGYVFRFQVLFIRSAVHLESTHSRDYNYGIRLYICLSAFDVQKLLRSEICAETRFCNHVIAKIKCRFGCNHAIAAVRNVCKRTAVNKCGRAFESLHQIRLYSVFQKCRHCALRFKVACRNGSVVIGVSDDDF